jgi:large subunit ribosomal protein L29
MKATEFRDLSDEELVAKSAEVRRELFNLKVKHSTGQLEDTARLAHLRRDVARMETVMRERREATSQ